MIFTTHSAGYSFSVKKCGAELCSLRGPDDTEFIWQADPTFWPRHAPNLFPIVGRLRNDSFTVNSTTYTLKQHGFARDTNFNLIDSAPGRLVFRLESSPSTRTRYPFDFFFDVEYCLQGPSLSITYRVQNLGATPLPFSVGAHPAFACSWQPGDTIADYSLEFDRPERVSTHILANGLLSGESRALLNGSTTLPLDAHTFDRDALILLSHESRAVTLKRLACSRRLTVTFPDFPHLGIWSKPGAPFICIEPWIGHADPVDAAGDLFAKPGIVTLVPSQAFAATYTILIDD